MIGDRSNNRSPKKSSPDSGAFRYRQIASKARPIRPESPSGDDATAPFGVWEVVVVDPVTIDVVRTDAVTITWEDGHVSRFPIQVLRANCMCAQCRGLRDRGEPAWEPAGDADTLEVESAAQVGNWGLNFHWNDGHTTGIFTWEVLRAWCLCESCAGN